MKTEEHLLFIERMARSLRGDLSPAEQVELKNEIESDPAKRAESVELMVTHDLLSLCAATDAPPSEVPQEALRLLRLEVEKQIKRKPVRWPFGPVTPLWASGIAAALVLGLFVFEQVRPLMNLDRALYALQRAPIKPVLDYALEAGPADTTGFLAFAGLNNDEPFESVLKRILNDASFKVIDSSNGQDWEQNWPQSDKQPIFKLLIREYGPIEKLQSNYGLIKVMGRWRGANFQKTFQITTRDGLPAALNEAQVFIEEAIHQ